MANELDYAYAAGILDGDGCISIYRNKAKSCLHGYRYALVIRVGMTDMEVPIWLHLKFGGSLSSGDNRGWGKKTMYQWGLHANQALDFHKRASPYLITKAKQAELAIQFQSDKYKGELGRGHRIPTVILEAEGILANKMHALNGGHNGR